MKTLLKKYLINEAISDAAKKILRNLVKATPEELSLAKKGLSDEIARLKAVEKPNNLQKKALEGAEAKLAELEAQALKGGGTAAEKAAEEAAAETKVAAKAAEEAKPAATVAADTSAAGKSGKEAKELPRVKKLDFSNPQSQEIADRIQGLRKAGATEEEIKSLKDQLLRNEGIATQEVDDISKRLQKLQSDYETAVKTGGEDSPRAKAIKNQMEKLNGVTTFTKIKRFCTGSYKKGGLCLAVLGAAGYGAYQLVDSLITPAPAPNPTPKPGPGGGGGRKCGSTLKSGCKGENVKQLQNKLIDCGYELTRKGADGWFGPETKAAVQSFQEDSGLKADGIAGANTMQALNKCNGTSKKEEVPEKETPLANEPQVVDVPATEKDKEEFNKAKTDFEKAQEEREALRKQYGSTNESLKRRRNEQLEKLVFERLVKGCK
jgi:murein L,D-transpeptidase YcbB/YkuD